MKVSEGSAGLASTVTDSWAPGIPWEPEGNGCG